MPAMAEPIWEWWCPDCAAGDGPYGSEQDAESAAAEHNDENHKMEEPPCQSAQ